MTRKSFARVERDIKLEKAQQALKNNTCWDDLHQVFVAANELMQKHLVIAGMLRNKELNAYLVDVKAVIENSKILEKDVKLLAKDLTDLYALHSSKTGGTDDPDVVMHTIGIYEQYQLFIQRHEALIMPTLGSILEQYHIAEQRLNVAVGAGREMVDEAVLDAEANIEEGVFTEVLPVGGIADQKLYDQAIANGTLVDLTATGSKDQSALASLVEEPVRARGEAPHLIHIDEAGFLPKEGA